MLKETGRGTTRAAGPRVWLIALLGVMALAISGVAAGAASAETTWLCKPGIANNPCESSLETTVENANGTSFIEHAQDARNPPIDCFYVYPTVSSSLTPNAPVAVEPEETQIAVDQAARFSQACKVYAPIYPQLTIPAINGAFGKLPAEDSIIAYSGVLTAFEEYLAKYNNGRGFVLIGHSQGSLQLEQLIKEQIDPNASLRKQLVSAVLLGGNVLVPKGGTVGATFQNVPTCSYAGQDHCVVAYSSFLKEPPANAFFGRVNSPLLGTPLPEEIANKLEVACVNPAVPLQKFALLKSGPLFTYQSTTPFPGDLSEFVKAPKASTPWVAFPAQYAGECKSTNGASWLQLNDIGGPGDPREQLAEVLGPEWGTHLADVNVALGNLVGTVQAEALTYQFLH